MKWLLLPLLSLAFLLGACSSLTQTAWKPGGSPISTGTRATAWGRMPTYEQEGHAFTLPAEKLAGPADTQPREAMLDVLVNADGSVEDATIRQSSGSVEVDRQILKAFQGGHYSLELGPKDPAPHVVQQTVVYSPETGRILPATARNYSGLGRQNSNPPAGAPSHQTWSGGQGG